MKVMLFTSAAIVASVLLAVPTARADQWNQKTTMTFNEPVEIPGHALQPGTYVFKLLNPGLDPNVVEVYNKNENHLYGIFLTIPDYRLAPTGKVIVTFAERPVGAPDALQAWFYPGDTYGHEFVYPHSEAMRLARANNRPVASMPDEDFNSQATGANDPSVQAMRQAHVQAVMPNGKTVETGTVFGTAAPNNH